MHLETYLIDSLAEGLVLFDGQGRAARVNPAAERLLGRSSASLQGLPFAEVFAQSRDLADMVAACLRENRAVLSGGVSLPSAGGGVFTLSVTVSPLQEPDGEPVGAAVLLRDETLMKEMDRAGMRAEQLATIGVLNLGMAHEIRNPLGAIKGAAQLLRRELSGAGRAAECCRVILREVERVDALIDGLLSAAPSAQSKFEPFNIHEVLDEVLSLMEVSGEQRRVAFKRVYDPSLPEQWGDRGTIRQAFLNIVKNAVEASPEGGTVTVLTRSPVNPPPGLRLRGGGRWQGVVEVEITDEGPGFDKEAPGFARPFYTTKPKGVGLGLVISEQIVQNHGGVMTLDNAGGGGAVVRVFLPMEGGERDG